MSVWTTPASFRKHRATASWKKKNAFQNFYYHSEIEQDDTHGTKKHGRRIVDNLLDNWTNLLQLKKPLDLDEVEQVDVQLVELETEMSVEHEGVVTDQNVELFGAQSFQGVEHLRLESHNAS